MPVYDLEEIRGVLFANGDVYCTQCLNKDESWKWEHLTKEDAPLYEKDTEDDAKVYICDTCGEQLQQLEAKLNYPQVQHGSTLFRGETNGTHCVHQKTME